MREHSLVSRGGEESLDKILHWLDCLSEADLDFSDSEFGVRLANDGAGCRSKMACKRTITSAAEVGRSSRDFTSSLLTSRDKSAAQVELIS